MARARATASPLAEAARVWARIAALSFGGPAGQIAVMHRILVEEKRWIGEARFLHALNYCMLLPGPGGAAARHLYRLAAAQDQRRAGRRRACSCCRASSRSWSCPGSTPLFGNVGAVAALFFGLKAAVLAIVLEAVRRIGRAGARNNVMRRIAAAAFVAIFFFGVPFPLDRPRRRPDRLCRRPRRARRLCRRQRPARHGGAETHLLGEDVPDHARPSLRWSLRIAAIFLLLWLAPVAGLLVLLGPDDVFSRIGLFFSQMAVVTFGGAYAVLAYVAQQAVGTYRLARGPARCSTASAWRRRRRGR